MTKISILILAALLSSCSTLKKTLIYSAASGAVVGGATGRALSPDKESNNFNTALGALTGALTSALFGYYFWSDANPDLKLKTPKPIENKKLPILDDPVLNLGNLGLPQNLEPLGSKQYISINGKTPEEINEETKRPYYRVYKTQKRKIEKGNKVYVVPSYKIYESGAE